MYSTVVFYERCLIKRRLLSKKYGKWAPNSISKEIPRILHLLVPAGNFATLANAFSRNLCTRLSFINVTTPRMKFLILNGTVRWISLNLLSLLSEKRGIDDFKRFDCINCITLTSCEMVWIYIFSKNISLVSTSVIFIMNGLHTLLYVNLILFLKLDMTKYQVCIWIYNPQVKVKGYKYSTVHSVITYTKGCVAFEWKILVFLWPWYKDPFGCANYDGYYYCVTTDEL